MADEMMTLGQKIHMAIADVLMAHDASLPSRWVIVCESLESDGSTNIWDVCNEGLSAWETLGMFAYGSKVIEARVIAAEVKGQEA